MPNVIVEDVVVGEGQGFADFVVRLDAPGTTQTRVDLLTESGTASSGGDFTSTSVNVVFSPGETVKTLRVPIVNDSTVESLESFTLRVASVNFEPSNGGETGTATIVDNDGAAGIPVATVSDLVIDERGAAARFVVMLDRPSTSIVSMSYATVNGTALAGSDYQAMSGTLSFAPGETAKTITVPIIDDATTEVAEAFSLVLSNVVGATVADPSAVAVIGASDQATVTSPNVIVEDVIVGEGQGFAEFLVRLDDPSSSETFATLVTNAGTAATTSDFTSTSVNVVFSPGETVKTLRVPIVNDSTVESLESFTLRVASVNFEPSNGGETGTATIVDNDTFQTSSGFETDGGNRSDTLLGTYLSDFLKGNDGNDVLSLAAGDDRGDGGSGNDVLVGGSGDDILIGGSGRDIAIYSVSRASATVSRATDGALVIVAGPDGTDTVYGVEQFRFSDGLYSVERFGSEGTPLIANFGVGAGGWSSQDLYPRHVGDVNGDGFSDVVGFGFGGVLVSFGSAEGSFSTASVMVSNFGQTAGWTSDDAFHRELADVNGDGRSDIVGFGFGGTLVSLGRADGTFTDPLTGAANFGFSQGWTSQTGFARTMGDVDGDGNADIIGFGAAGTLVALGNGDGTFGTAAIRVADFGVAQGWSNDTSFHRTVADVDGDGNADIVGFGAAGTLVALSNGDGTFETARLVLDNFGAAQGWSSQDAFARAVADVNGDGRADIVGFGAGGTFVAYGLEDGTFSAASFDVENFGQAQGWTSDRSFHRTLADIDNDGLNDVVGFGFAGVLAGFNQGDVLM